MLPEKFEFRFIIGAHFRWLPYFHRYTAFVGFEVSFLGLYFQVVVPMRPKPRVQNPNAMEAFAAQLRNQELNYKIKERGLCAWDPPATGQASELKD